ncbi:MAG: hypothetical protein IJ629_01545 [Clostridia bacterium]|nr:hypothetical protein [Clostridia bacterium]
MRSNKGITMMGLVIYITSFLLVAGIIAGITAFFYGNSTLMTQELYSAADYNKLNLYLVRESEQVGNRVADIVLSNVFTEEEDTSGKDADYITFSNGDKFTFDQENNLLYYNSICLCEDVQNFKIDTDYSSGKEVLSVMVGFTNKSYSCKYTMAQ